MATDILTIESLNGEQISQLMTMFRNEAWSKQRTSEDVKILLANSHVVALVNKNNDELIAFARYLSDHVYRAMIFDVMVSAEYRGLGYGKKLMKLVCQSLTNIERVELYCRQPNIAFYEQFAFRQVPLETYLMRKTLGSKQ